MVHVMSEVKRYTFKGAAGEYVYAPDFDAQRLRADTAEAERDALKTALESSELEVDTKNEEIALSDQYAKYQDERITAAEQRIAELTNVERVTMAILGKDKDPSPGVNWTAHRIWRVNDVR